MASDGEGFFWGTGLSARQSMYCHSRISSNQILSDQACTQMQYPMPGPLCLLWLTYVITRRQRKVMGTDLEAEVCDENPFHREAFLSCCC
jgi:hypothetical protein